MERDLGLHVKPVALLERQPSFARGQLTSRRRSTCHDCNGPAAIEKQGESMRGSKGQIHQNSVVH